jgi:hypothetical protein
MTSFCLITSQTTKSFLLLVCSLASLASGQLYPGTFLIFSLSFYSENYGQRTMPRTQEEGQLTALKNTKA